MDSQTLMKQYPFLDEMMAETLIRAYEGGYLETVIAKSTQPSEEAEPQTHVIKGAVKIE